MIPKNIHYAWFILAGCCVLQFVGMGVLLDSVGIFFGPVTRELGVELGALTFYLFVQGIAMTFALPIAGKIIPRVNIRLLLTGVSVVLAGTLLAMSTFDSVAQWYVAGALLGICGAFIAPLPIPILLNNWFEKRNGMVIGIAMAFSGVAAVIVNPTVSALMESFGWRTGYLAVGTLAAVLLIPVSLFVLYLKPSDKGLLPYGAQAKQGDSNGNHAISEVPQGITARQAFRMPMFYLVLLFAGLVTYAGGFNQHLPRYATSVDLTPAVGAAMIAIVLGTHTIVNFPLGMLCDKIGVVHTALIGIISGVLGITVVLQMPHSNFVYLGSVLLGVAISLTLLIPPVLTREAFGPQDYGFIYSFVVMAFSFFGSMSTGLNGVLYDLSGSYRLSMAMSGVAYISSFALLFLIMGLARNHKKNESVGYKKTKAKLGL